MYKLKTNTMSKGYYKRQLEKVDTKNEYPASFKVTSPNGDTNWMNLNEESVNDLREWLDERFPVVPKVMIKLEDVQDKKSFDCITCPDYKTKEHCKECDNFYKTN